MVEIRSCKNRPVFKWISYNFQNWKCVTALKHAANCQGVRLVGKGHFYNGVALARLNLGKDSGAQWVKNLKLSMELVHRLQLQAVQRYSEAGLLCLFCGRGYLQMWMPSVITATSTEENSCFLHNLAKSSHRSWHNILRFRGKKSPWWLHSLMINHDKLKPLLKTPVFRKPCSTIQQSLWRQTQWPWCPSIMVFWASWSSGCPYQKFMTSSSPEGPMRYISSLSITIIWTA